MMNHEKFILSPLSTILTDINLASHGAGTGIETFPLCDYLMQSVFLRLTGAQEQKMKCIFWEIASHDFEYRQKKIRAGISGEFSSYTDKDGIYQDLVSQISKAGCSAAIDSIAILRDTMTNIKEAFLDTNLYSWAQKSFRDFENIGLEFDISHFSNEQNLLVQRGNIKQEKRLSNGKCLKSIYIDHLYAHRNRVAHNTLSYQQNLPTLSRLKSVDYIYDNYFLYFFVLTLIDNVIIDLFTKYVEARETTSIF